MMPYERFQAWKAAHRAALEIYRETDRWPKEERFGLTIQLRRAALSDPANLLRFSRDYGLLSERSWLDLETIRSEAGRLTWSLYYAVSRRSVDSPENSTRPLPPVRPSASPPS
jgi:23S rRNA-intervening sequence protein